MREHARKSKGIFRLFLNATGTDRIRSLADLEDFQDEETAMCMMKNSGEKEACEVANNLAALDGRVTKVEERMNKIEGSLNDGFKSLSVSISNLGHDVGSRVNLIEKKVVDEKQEGGKSFRKWLDWIVKLLIIGCGTAMGVTAWKLIFGN